MNTQFSGTNSMIGKEPHRTFTSGANPQFTQCNPQLNPQFNSQFNSQCAPQLNPQFSSLPSLPAELKRYEITMQERQSIGMIRQRLGNLWTPRYTDVRICRFLRARDGNIEQAEDMLRKEMQWRAQVCPERIVAELVHQPAFQTITNYWPSATHGTDRFGVPIILERLGAVDTAGLLIKSNQDMLIKMHIYCMEEHDTMMMAAWEAIGAPVGYIHIEDLEGLSMKHYSNQALTIMKEIARIDENFYPEILRKFVIVNAPSVFKFFWKLAKGVLHKNTINKFEMVDRVDANLLSDSVTRNNMPRYLGGACAGCPHVAAGCKFGGGKAPML